MTSKLFRKFKDWCVSAPISPRLTKAEAIEIARRHLCPDGDLFLPGAGPVLEEGRIIWRVVTHVGYRGGHDQVYVDDYTGNVLRTHHVDR